jgi:hypothetical protein
VFSALSKGKKANFQILELKMIFQDRTGLPWPAAATFYIKNNT